MWVLPALLFQQEDKHKQKVYEEQEDNQGNENLGGTTLTTRTTRHHGGHDEHDELEKQKEHGKSTTGSRSRSSMARARARARARTTAGYARSTPQAAAQQLLRSSSCFSQLNSAAALPFYHAM